MNNPANRFFPKSVRNLKKTNLNTVSAVLILFLLFGCVFPSFAQQQLKISDGQFSKKLPQIPSRNIEYVSDGVIVTYTFTDVLSMQAENKGRFFWKIPGFGTLSDEGFPMIPNRVDAFTIDENHDVKLTVLEEEYTDYVIEMAAAGPIKTDLSTAQPVKEFSEMQQFKGFYPKETVSEMETEFYRGRPIFKFMVCPVQYSQKEKLTRFYTKLRYKITYTESSKKKASALELTKQLPMVEENSIYDRIGIPLIKPKENIQKAIPVQWSEPGKRLLILTNNEQLPAAQRLAEWKRCLGYNTEVIRVPHSRTPEQVKNVIQNRYNSTGLDYLLIIGDSIAVNAKQYYEYASNQQYNPQWSPWYLSDHYYVCMDGDNDHFPDIHKGRIPSHNLEEAYNAVNKIIRYEKNPPSDPSFYKNGINLAQLELKNPNGTTEYKEYLRFIFSSENIRDYLLDNYNLNIERVYATKERLKSLKPFKYNAFFCFDGYYSNNNTQDINNFELMPDELQNLDVWKYYTEACGWFYPLLSKNKPSFLFYSGHGDVDRWSTPSILVQNHLRNHHVFSAISYPVMLFSICCQNGKYNRPDCFVSEWINNKSGAVGAFACTHFGLADQQMAQIDLMFNCIWPKDYVNFSYGKYNRTEKDSSTSDEYVSIDYPEKFPRGMTMGQVLDDSFSLVPNISNIPSTNDESQYQRRVTHYFGDPTMRWYIENPGTYTPNYWESGNDIVFSGNRPETIIAIYDTQTNEVTRHHNAQSLAINKEKAKHCVVTSVGYDIRPWSWIGEDVDLEVLSNQSILNY